MSIFSNLKIVIFDFPLRYQPGQLYQSQNITAFISSMVTSACNYDISLDFPLSSINCNDCANNYNIKNHGKLCNSCFLHWLEIRDSSVDIPPFYQVCKSKREGSHASYKIYQLFNVHK